MRSRSRSGCRGVASRPHTPSASASRSSNGNSTRNGLAPIASATVLPAGTSKLHSCTSRGAGEYTSVTRRTASGIDALGALDERVDQASGDLVEHGADERGQRRVVEAIAKLQFHLARALAIATERDELPKAVQPRERPVDQMHAHFVPRDVLVARSEGLVDAAERDAHLRLHAVAVALDHRGTVAPWQ